MPKLHFTTPDGATHEFELAADRARIGRADDNDFVLPDSSVSSRHGEFIRKGDGVELVDLGSTNGTHVGGQRVERADIAPGGKFKLGSVDGVFINDAAGAAPGADAAGESTDDGSGGSDESPRGSAASGNESWNVSAGNIAAITGIGATDCPKNLRRGFGPKVKEKSSAGIFTLLGALSLLVCAGAAFLTGGALIARAARRARLRAGSVARGREDRGDCQAAAHMPMVTRLVTYAPPFGGAARSGKAGPCYFAGSTPSAIAIARTVSIVSACAAVLSSR